MFHVHILLLKTPFKDSDWNNVWTSYFTQTLCKDTTETEHQSPSCDSTLSDKSFFNKLGK